MSMVASTSEVRHMWPVVIIRTFILALFFLSGVASLFVTQYVGLELTKTNAQYREALINLTKKQFFVLLTYMTSWISPCTISITYDPDTLPSSNSFKVDANGYLTSNLTPNSVVIMNHQLYTDWLYLWYITYTARLAESVIIMLKDLSKIPVLGYGMTNFNFLFLSRKWEKDKVVLTNQLLTIDANARGLGPANGVKFVSSTDVADSSVQHWPDGHRNNQIWPYQIILFPEGTVTAARTRKKSDEFCDSKNIPRLKHSLLPRTRGLFLTLRKLRDTVEIIYDVTCGYSDLKPHEYGEDVFTLKGSYFLGMGPKRVHYYIKGWKISDIPLGEETDDIDDVSLEDVEKFEQWLFGVWYQKDKLLEGFYERGSFVDPTSKAIKPTVQTPLRIKNIVDVISSFTTLFAIILIVRLVWIFCSKFFMI